MDAPIKAENVQGKKLSVPGGDGTCIYCGWDGGADGLGDEHVVPYSLGGKTELLKASCRECEGIAWIDINRSVGLVDLQDRFHRAVVENAGVSISALGDKWNPHWTLLAEPRELVASPNRSITFNEADLLPSGEKAGEVVLGLSGPNGQFRGVLSSVSKFRAKHMPALGG